MLTTTQSLGVREVILYRHFDTETATLFQRNMDEVSRVRVIVNGPERDYILLRTYAQRKSHEVIICAVVRLPYPEENEHEATRH